MMRCGWWEDSKKVPCWAASSREMAVPKRSGSVNDSVGGVSVEPRLDAPSLPVTELARDRDRLEPENNDEKVLDERRPPLFALEERLKLPRGCFFVKRRGVLS